MHYAWHRSENKHGPPRPPAPASVAPETLFILLMHWSGGGGGGGGIWLVLPRPDPQTLEPRTSGPLGVLIPGWKLLSGGGGATTFSLSAVAGCFFTCRHRSATPLSGRRRVFTAALTRRRGLIRGAPVCDALSPARSQQTPPPLTLASVVVTSFPEGGWGGG